MLLCFFGGWNGALGNSGFTALTLFQSSLFGGFGRCSEIGAVPAGAVLAGVSTA